MHTIALTPPSETIARARTLADKLATNERRPAYVVMDGAHPLVACSDDMGVYWADSQVVYKADPPGPNPEDDSEGDSTPPDRPRAPSLYELLVAACQAELEARFSDDYHVVSTTPFCAQPDNLCSVHDPCPAHAADAARFLAQRALTTWQSAELSDEDMPF